MAHSPLTGTVRAWRGTTHITGTSRDDVLVGTAGPDVIRGLAGNDDITGGDGRDRLLGGRGGDVLRSRDGHTDLAHGGRGSDRAVADRRDRVRRL